MKFRCCSARMVLHFRDRIPPFPLMCGQKETEVVLQNPGRIKGLVLFLGGIMLCQILLVIKKKQVETVQAAEMNF